MLILHGHARSRADTVAPLRAEGHEVGAEAALNRARRAGRNRCEVA